VRFNKALDFVSRGIAGREVKTDLRFEGTEPKEKEIDSGKKALI